MATLDLWRCPFFVLMKTVPVLIGTISVGYISVLVGLLFVLVCIDPVLGEVWGVRDIRNSEKEVMHSVIYKF